MTPRIRLYLSCLLVSSWLALLLTGNAFGGLVHLLLAAALILFPWRAAASGVRTDDPEDTPDAGGEA